MLQIYRLIKNCNHRRIGVYYPLSAFLFGLPGGIFSLFIRLELSIGYIYYCVGFLFSLLLLIYSIQIGNCLRIYRLIKNCNRNRVCLYYTLSACLFGLTAEILSLLIRLALYSSEDRIIY